MGASSGAFSRSRAESAAVAADRLDIEVLMDESKRCQARSKRTGKQCGRAAVPGKRVCYYHGGASTGPKTPEGKARCSLNGLKHGFFAKRILNEDEQRLFDDIVAQLHQDFVLNESSDVIAIEAMGLALVQLSRAIEGGNVQAAETFDRMVRSHLKDLKATKLAREGETSTNLNTSPAEWATALLEKIRKSEKPKTKGKKASRGKTQKKRQI